MTNLDELKQAWEVHDNEIDQSNWLNQKVLLAEGFKRVQSPMQRLRSMLTVEIVAAALGIFVLGRFLGDHIAELRFEWPALLLDIWLIACMAASIRQLIAARKINYDKPVAAMQRQLAGLRVLRLRAFRWALLTGQIVWWVPFAIVALKLFLDVDAYRFLSTVVIVINLLLGLMIIPVAIRLAKQFGSRMLEYSWMRRLSDEIAGRSLTDAQAYAAMLSEFESAAN